nr:PREDICTED: protein melted [Bemisia tabaci]
MHELFTQVLSKKDLSKAGELFSVANEAIVDDLTEVLNTILEITSLSDYANNDNDQSVVEICITRVTSCIRETGSMEQHAEAMVALLESCLSHNLKPCTKDEDPPHAKISSDLISCIFLNYGKKTVMRRALPVAVKFLHKGNKEISRNMASYLSLAAIDNADLLSKHIQLIIDSVIAGNYPLCRVLPQIYAITKEPIHDHAMALVSLLPLCDLPEKLALLQLCSLIATQKPSLLEASLPQLCEYLGAATTASATLQVLLHLAEKKPQLLSDYMPKIKQAAKCNPKTLCLAAQVISAVGKLSKDKAQEALNFVLEHLPKADRGSQTTLLREATLLCSCYPVLFTDKMLNEVRQCSNKNKTNDSALLKISSNNNSSNTNNSTMNRNNNKENCTKNNNSGNINTINSMKAKNINNSNINNITNSKSSIVTNVSNISSSQINQTSHGVTIVKVGSGGHVNHNNNLLNHSITPMYKHNISSPTYISTNNNHRLHDGPQSNRLEGNRVVIGGRSRLVGGDSRSTGRLHSSATHRSMTRLNIVSSNRLGSVGGLHKSMTRLSSSQQINQVASQMQQVPSNRAVTTVFKQSPLISGGVTVTTRNSLGSGNVPREENSLYSSSSQTQNSQSNRDSTAGIVASRPLSTAGSSPLYQSLISTSQPLSQISVGNLSSQIGPTEVPPPPTQPVVTSRRPHNNTSVTIINNHSNAAIHAASQRISVFEPYPMRDTIQHFCEKHLDKIKSYMEKVSVRIPPPAKCTIEERRAKKVAKLHFGCPGRGEHCLYSRTFFTMRTRNPRVWIHLMFLALQARSPSALSSRDASVSSLKNCWDILKCETKTFLTLVTSAFPCAKDQEAVLSELRSSGFCDVFEYVGGSGVNLWGCFLCNHPERAVGFLQDSQPVIEGQLKEKKGRWKIFKRWRTRYFTLSGAHLSYKGADDKAGPPIDVHQIRSVKVSRGARNIPKAFEIFTGDHSLILKPKDGKNAEEWVQCLSVVVAHSQSKEMPTRSSSLIRTAV